MLILIACECSGKVRDAFLRKGHEVYSCDLQRCPVPGPHFQQSVTDLLHYRWDMLIGFPPCTYLTCACTRFWKDPTRIPKQQAAFDFFMLLMKQHHIPKICLENPVGIVSTWFRPPSQVIHPFQFGEETKKKTCLWLKGLPKLLPTQMTIPTASLHNETRNPKQRSITFNGIARAMADQWG